MAKHNAGPWYTALRIAAVPRRPRRRRRRLHLVQGLPHPAAGGLRRRRALAPRRALRRPGRGALQVRLARRRGRPRHPLPDLPRAAAGLRRPPARPRRLPRLRHPLGGGPRAAGRLLQEDHGLPAHHPDLRHLPRRELPHRPPTPSPVIVPTGPSHTTNAMAFLDFLEAAANDPRWSGDGMMPEIERNFDLGLDDKLIYRFVIIPIAKEARARAGARLRLDPHPRPPGLGPRPRRPVQPDQVQPPRAPRRRHRRQRRLPLDLERRPAREHLAQLGRRDPGPARGLYRQRARHRRAAGDRRATTC